VTRSTNILVTGGAGYIGSHTCKALAQAGYTPVTYDNLSRGHRWAVQWGPLEEGDILDDARLRDVFRHYCPAAVIHFAALAYVGESVASPELYYRNNVAGTLSLLGAMLDNGPDQLVFSSTCATYGTPSETPITEHHPQQPINPYGRSKHMIEQMLWDLEASDGLRSVALRYFNAAGADPDGEIGEAHEPETHLIPLVLAAASGNAPAIIINGTDYDTPDGTCIRDYIHVTDLADAHVRALRRLEDGAASGAYNLGTGHGYSIREVIDTARKVTGRTIPCTEGGRRAGDPPELVADAHKARTMLGWQPGYSDLPTIIDTAWRWMQQEKVDRAVGAEPRVL